MSVDKKYMLGMLKDQIEQLSNEDLILSLQEEIEYYMKKYIQDSYRGQRALLLVNELNLRLLMNQTISKTLH